MKRNKHEVCNMSSSADIGKIDSNLAVKNSLTEGMDIYSVDAENMELFGFYWRKPGEPLHRFPASMDMEFNQGVKNLSRCTAGGHLRFRSDADCIKVHARVEGGRMSHMAFVGSRGFDLYVGKGQTQVFAKSSVMNQADDEYTAVLFQSPNRIMRDFTIYFPLYSEVKFVEIAVTAGARVEPPTPWQDNAPIVVYGTSITQGGCVSRPGMLYSNILSRLVKRPVYNFGFSGSGKGEAPIAHKLTEIADPAMYILDYDDNAHPDLLKETLLPFINILREKYPVVPILALSTEPKSAEAFEPFDSEYASKERGKYNAIHQEVQDLLRQQGDDNVYFLDGRMLYGADFEECTVDGAHATDLGTYRTAHALAPLVERILNRWW